MSKSYTEEELRAEVTAMEQAVRDEAEKAMRILERRARSKIKTMKADHRALKARIAMLEGETEEGARTYTQEELDAKIRHVEKRCYAEARAVIEETEQRALEEIGKWRSKAKDLGDSDAATAEEEAKEREKEDAAADDYDLSKYRWSKRVIQQVMRKYEIDDEMKLVAAAVHFDNGDRYLNKAELESGAKVLSEGS